MLLQKILVHFIFYLIGVTANDIIENHDIYQKFPESGRQILEILNQSYNQDSANHSLNLENSIFSHGCWCSKFQQNKAPNLLGGTAIDAVDVICKKWFSTRFCNDDLFGGSCYNNDNDNNYFDLSENYYYQIGQMSSNSVDFRCNAVNQVSGRQFESCELDSCLIDYHFAKMLLNYLFLNHDSSRPFLPVADSVCIHKGSYTDKLEECIGSAPFLNRVKISSEVPIDTCRSPTTNNSQEICETEPRQHDPVYNQNNGHIQHILSESNTNSSIPIDSISFCTKGFQDQNENGWSWISKAGDIELEILDPEADSSLSKPPCTPSNLKMVRFTKTGSETGGCRWFGMRSFSEFLNQNLTISFYYKFDYIDGDDIQNRGGLKIAQRIVGTAWIDNAYDCIDNWCYYELSFVYDWTPKKHYIFVFNFDNVNFGMRFVVADFQAKITDQTIENGDVIENWNNCV